MPMRQCKPSLPSAAPNMMAGLRLLVLVLVFCGSFFTASVASDDALFSEAFVRAHRGVLTQGGLVVLTLQPNTQVWLNDDSLDQLDNQALIGFGRDAALISACAFCPHSGRDRARSNVFCEFEKTRL